MVAMIMAGSLDLSQGHVRAFIDRARIDCEHLNPADRACPRYFGALADTGDPSIRHCPACERPVYLVTTEDELFERAEQRQCMALILPAEIPESPYDAAEEDGGKPRMMLGRPSPGR